ncbi:TetR/AcrR family transcriptional regulator [Nocardioides caeni]|uniref:TetR/AcrR family transcriptional regulator n=1 Tax=Nocardioides caeni TaxID=574700 RepID=A0A4S8N733_9ACTN|nr:TetR/AcrR family transcriptional regulator [Nocardioides caeni]THV10494.1 TetR/AcrR family transcriptional regulator [Nocardioides caeni]
MSAETTEPRWRRLGPDARRTDILVAAVRHFTDRPFPEVGIAAIAEDAGVTRALVHHYFGTKRGLYLASVRAMMFVPALDGALPTDVGRPERIRAIVGWLMDVVEQHGRSWLAMAGSGAGDPEVQAVLDEADDLAAERVLDYLGFAGDAAQLRDAHAAVRAFGGLAKAMGRELVERRSLTGDQARSLLSSALEAMLDDLDDLDDLNGLEGLD